MNDDGINEFDTEEPTAVEQFKTTNKMIADYWRAIWTAKNEISEKVVDAADESR